MRKTFTSLLILGWGGGEIKLALGHAEYAAPFCCSVVAAPGTSASMVSICVMEERAMHAGNAENIRENLWVYRVYKNMSREQLAKGIVPVGRLRAYEYGFEPVPEKHLEAIIERLGITYDDLAAPPDYKAVLNWQTRKMVEYYRSMPSRFRHHLKNLMRSISDEN